MKTLPSRSRKAKPEAKAKPEIRTPDGDADTRSLSIRMYRQGLGDCFLIGLPGKADKTFWMMIDCGVALATDDRQEKFDALIADVKKTVGKGGIDVLVITHDHFDHVSGFLHVAEDFKRIGVKQIWFAWTEDPDDPLARRLVREREERVRKLAGFVRALDGREIDNNARGTAQGVGSILSFFGLEDFGADGDLPVSKAMAEIRALQESVNAGIRYCRPGEPPIDGAGLGIDGFRVYVLGPPQDETLLRRTDARGMRYEKDAADDEEKDEKERQDERKRKRQEERKLAEEQYNQLVNDEAAFFAAVNAAPDAGNLGPFEAGMGRPLQKYLKYIEELKEGQPPQPGREPDIVERFLKERYVGRDENSYDQAWRRIDSAWYGAAAEFALHLDGATNNTSLVLAIEDTRTRKVFLFPGDAQVGNWQGWQRCRWTVDGREVTANDLLARTVFYKVGHHGSPNATMRQDGLERMIHPDLVAMIPVERATAEKMRWHDMPLENLLRALKEATRGSTVLLDEDYAGPLKLEQNETFQEVRFDL